MRYLGLDLGTKTLGLAITDKLGIISSPYKVLRYDDINKLIEELLIIIKEENIDELVLGLTKNMNNSIGFGAERSLNFKKLLEEKCDKKIHLVDERLSTVEAERFLISTDTSRNKRKKIIDSYAASIILETYLNKRKDQNNG